MICPVCGLVVGDRVVDVGSEWRTFSSDKETKDMSRVGAAEVIKASFLKPGFRKKNELTMNLFD